MSLVELIAQADERGLAASGLACLERCVPLLGGDDEVLRPLWGSLSDAGDDGEWGTLLEQVRGKLVPHQATFAPSRRPARTLAAPAESPTLPAAALAGADEYAGSVEDEAALLARRMLAAAPAQRSGAEMRVWADGCSVAALQIHRLLDPLADRASSVDSRREGLTEGMSPLVAAELRRQVTVLEVLAGHGAAGLRRALEVSVEGRRVLKAVVSRRARKT